MKLYPAEKLNLGISAGAVAASFALAPPLFAGSLAAGAMLGSVNFRFLHRTAEGIFNGLVQSGSWIVVLVFRLALVFAGICAAMMSGADAIGLVIGLSLVVIALVARPAAAEEAALFGPAAADGLVELTRLRCLDDQPAVLQRSRVGLVTLGETTAADLENASLYRYLAECRGVQVATVEETLEPWSVSAEEAEPLAIAPGTAVFRSQRVARDATGAVVEVSDNLIRGDIYRFTIHRDVTDSAPGATV